MSGAIDYRVSRIVVLCKDCGYDVGLYPARHKCGVAAEGSLLNSIPEKKPSTQNNSNKSSEEHSGEGLWGKLRSVRNWKDVNEGGTGNVNLSQLQPQPQPQTQTQPTQTQGYKLWDKLLSAAAAYKAAEGDSENESEKDDWEGETHISRILREYYMEKSGDIPRWLYDSKSSSDKKSTENSTITSLRSSRKRLTERDENLSSRPNTDDISGRGLLKSNDINRKEQLKVYPSSSNAPLPVPVINRGRENNGHDRPSNRDLNHYAQNSSQLYPDKYNARSLNTHPLPNGDGGTHHQRLGVGTKRLDDFTADRSRGRELSTNNSRGRELNTNNSRGRELNTNNSRGRELNTNNSRGRELSTNTNSNNRARSVSPSPSARMPPPGAYNRYGEIGDVRNRSQDARIPPGKIYRNNVI